MTTFITPPIGKSFALLATMHKGFAANGNTLMVELYETGGDLSHDDR